MRNLHKMALFICLSGALFAQAESNDGFKKAEQYFFQKKYEIAEEMLIQVIQKNPSHTKAYSYLGDINLFYRRYDNAIKYYNQAKTVSSKPGQEYFRLGQVYLELKKPEEALDNFLSAYSLDPSFKPSLYEAGYVYLVYKRDKLKTIEYWKKFINEAPMDAQYQQVKKAIAMLEDANCTIPPENSGISIEEVLMNCGSIITPEFGKTHDAGAGVEKEKTNNDTEGLLNDTPNGF